MSNLIFVRIQGSLQSLNNGYTCVCFITVTNKKTAQPRGRHDPISVVHLWIDLSCQRLLWPRSKVECSLMLWSAAGFTWKPAKDFPLKTNQKQCWLGPIYHVADSRCCPSMMLPSPWECWSNHHSDRKCLNHHS